MLTKGRAEIRWSSRMQICGVTAEIAATSAAVGQALDQAGEVIRQTGAVVALHMGQHELHVRLDDQHLARLSLG